MEMIHCSGGELEARDRASWHRAWLRIFSAFSAAFPSVLGVLRFCSFLAPFLNLKRTEHVVAIFAAKILTAKIAKDAKKYS